MARVIKASQQPSQILEQTEAPRVRNVLPNSGRVVAAGDIAARQEAEALRAQFEQRRTEMRITGKKAIKQAEEEAMAIAAAQAFLDVAIHMCTLTLSRAQRIEKAHEDISVVCQALIQQLLGEGTPLGLPPQDTIHNILKSVISRRKLRLSLSEKSHQWLQRHFPLTQRFLIQQPDWHVETDHNTPENMTRLTLEAGTVLVENELFWPTLMKKLAIQESSHPKNTTTSPLHDVVTSPRRTVRVSSHSVAVKPAVRHIPDNSELQESDLYGDDYSQVWVSKRPAKPGSSS